MNNKANVIVIVGPTAVGKTNLSIKLAKLLNGEIISADSMQVYKHMNIGTAKPTLEERSGIIHYLIDEINPDEEFSVAQYKVFAENYIEKILSDNKTPIIVGGTGLYIDTLIKNIQFSETVCDENYRQELAKAVEHQGNEYLHSMLSKVDPESALRLHPNDIKRIIRALEVYKCTGKPISFHQSISLNEPVKYNYILIGILMDRQLLYERINIRVDEMINVGLVNEVKELLRKGYNKELTSMQGIGYKEIIDYLNGECTLEETIEQIKQSSRRYAKRQLTWFRKNKSIAWFDVTNEEIENILKKVYEYIVQYMEMM